MKQDESSDHAFRRAVQSHQIEFAFQLGMLLGHAGLDLLHHVLVLVGFRRAFALEVFRERDLVGAAVAVAAWGFRFADRASRVIEARAEKKQQEVTDKQPSRRAVTMPRRSRTAARRLGNEDGLAYQSPPPPYWRRATVMESVWPSPIEGNASRASSTGK